MSEVELRISYLEPAMHHSTCPVTCELKVKLGWVSISRVGLIVLNLVEDLNNLDCSTFDVPIASTWVYSKLYSISVAL